MTISPNVTNTFTGPLPIASYLATPALCTLQTCPLTWDGVVLSAFTYIPVLSGNVVLLAIFAALLLPQFYLSIRYKVWGYLVAMVFGLALEIIGYTGRVQMHYNPFTQQPYLTQLICLTIAPAFFSGAVYLCLSRIVILNGLVASRFAPRTYTIVFVIFDFISLCLQGVGGGIAATGNTNSTVNTGRWIMIGGLLWQVVCTAIFIVVCADYYLRVRLMNPTTTDTEIIAGDEDAKLIRASLHFKLFLFGLAVATTGIFTRSIFRVAELWGGFNGSLENQEIPFMILEGGVIAASCIALTLGHPGWAFQGYWGEVNFSLKGNGSMKWPWTKVIRT
ncbi:RTA1 like protein-domain-containing protein [Lipomyces mesembrius]